MVAACRVQLKHTTRSPNNGLSQRPEPLPRPQDSVACASTDTSSHPGPDRVSLQAADSAIRPTAVARTPKANPHYSRTPGRTGQGATSTYGSSHRHRVLTQLTSCAMFFSCRCPRPRCITEAMLACGRSCPHNLVLARFPMQCSGFP